MTAALLTALAVSACSSPSAPSTPSTPSAPAAPTTAAAASNSSASTCAALVSFDARTNTYPGGDPSSPPPTAAELMTWGATAVGPLAALAAAVPAELSSAIATLRTAVQATQDGKPVNIDDPVLNKASSTLDQWGHDNCGFAKLDVSGSGTELSGVPATLPAGPLSVSFTNGGSTAKGFVLLVAKVKDGAKYTLDGIKNGSIDFTSIADIVGTAQPTAQLPTAYSTTILTAGKYLLVSPAGAPPNFTGTQVGEFTVS